MRIRAIVIAFVQSLALSGFAGQTQLDESLPRSLAVSSDGKMIAVACEDNCVRVWSLVSEERTHRLKLDHSGTSVAFSPDGLTVLAGTVGDREEATQPVRSQLFAWSLADGEPKLKWKSPVRGRIMGIAAAPGGQWCAAITVYATLGVYRMSDGALIRNLSEAGNPPHDVAITADGKTIVTAGQRLILWDALRELPKSAAADPEKAVSTELSERFIRARAAGSSATAIASDGKWAVAIGAFANPGRNVDVATIDLETGKVSGIIAKGIEHIACVAVSPSGRQVALGLATGEVVVLDVMQPNSPIMWHPPGFDNIDSLAYVDQGRHLVIAIQGGRRVAVIDANSRKVVKELYSSK